MQLFNASSLFTEDAKQEVAQIAHQPELLRARIIDIKQKLLAGYRFSAHNVPADFTRQSYVLATNHLTDSDAPLIMSFYYDVMRDVVPWYPALFVFAKENCFNGVSIPKELLPILQMEQVVEVDRGSLGGAKDAMNTARRWYHENEKPRHFLLFAQGTIYDINKDSPEDIESGAFWLARMLGIPVLPGFIEQAVEGEETRLVFAQPLQVPKTCRDFAPLKETWLKRVIAAQDSLESLTGRPARPAVLDAEHQTRKRFRPAGG